MGFAGCARVGSCRRAHARAPCAPSPRRKPMGKMDETWCGRSQHPVGPANRKDYDGGTMWRVHGGRTRWCACARARGCRGAQGVRLAPAPRCTPAPPAHVSVNSPNGGHSGCVAEAERASGHHMAVVCERGRVGCKGVRFVDSITQSSACLPRAHPPGHAPFLAHAHARARARGRARAHAPRPRGPHARAPHARAPHRGQLHHCGHAREAQPPSLAPVRPPCRAECGLQAAVAGPPRRSAQTVPCCPCASSSPGEPGVPPRTLRQWGVMVAAARRREAWQQPAPAGVGELASGARRGQWPATLARAHSPPRSAAAPVRPPPLWPHRP